MSSRTRSLIAGSVLVAVVSAGIVWFAVIRDKTKPQERPKTTAELLIGTWVCNKQVPPFSPTITASSEFTEDGKNILRLTDARRGPLPPMSGLYQLKGNTIRFDFEDSEEPGGPLYTWNAKIELITEEVLILVGIDGKTNRVEYERKPRE